MGMWDAQTISPEINGEGPAVHDLAPSRGLHGQERPRLGECLAGTCHGCFHMQQLLLLLHAASMGNTLKWMVLRRYVRAVPAHPGRHERRRRIHERHPPLRHK